MSWRFGIDTGGTFTDCIAITPEGTVRRAKVLSDSSLKARVIGLSGSRNLILEKKWDLPDDFFHGFQARLTGEENELIQVEKWCADKGVLELVSAFSRTPVAGDMIELLSSEEPPILGARILTGTPSDCPLPKLTMRLGTTRGTNALLEEKGADVVFFASSRNCV